MAKHTNPARGIFLRGSTYWLTYQIRGKRTRVSLETSDFPEAVRRAEELRAHPHLQPSDGLNGDIEAFLAYKLDRGEFSKASAQSKGYVLKRFSTYVGAIPPSSVTIRMIQGFYEETRKSHTLSTANSYLMMLRSFFKWAVEVKKIARTNPCKEVKMIESKRAARRDFCTREQRDLLISSCQREDLKFVLYCGFYAGMRMMEIIEARAFWFDMDAKIIHLRKTPTMSFKDGEERAVPMTGEFHRFLREYELREPYMLRPEVKPGKSLYRYTFASLLASAGTSIYLISEWLGDDVRVTQRHYARLLPLHNEIERAFTAGPPA